MAKNPLTELENYRKKAAVLEQKAAKYNQRLLDLPNKMGFKTIDALVAALKLASKSGAVEATAKKAKAKSRKRAKITPKIEAKVKALVEQGKPGLEIAEVVGISTATVANIKKKLGLVREAK